MTRAQDRQGKAGQERAAAILRARGILCVEKIGTPVRLIPVKGKAGAYIAIWGEKVAGDHRGVLPGGRSVLAETKAIFDRNLVWSDMRPHQPEKLDEHTSAGGLTLLVWASARGTFIMKWPIEGFGPGKGITPERADELDSELDIQAEEPEDWPRGI
jgi:hypothetical protein